jgi:type IV pilus assembly protein PilO
LQYDLDFAVSGGYEQLKRFIHLLENSPRILIIHQIALAGSEGAGSGKPGVQLQIHLTTFFQEEAP